MDAVFGDSFSLRAAIDRFLHLQEEMEEVREHFQTTVNHTLALLPERAVRGRCPDEVTARYREAHLAGTRFLALGRKMRELHRHIERADELGDTQGLTPNYRYRAKRANHFYRGLLGDYREMRVAFHDQLGAELRHAGCPVQALLRQNDSGTTPAFGETPETDPTVPLAWETEEGLPLDGLPLAGSKAAIDPRPVSKTGKTAMDPGLQGDRGAQAIWIEIDNRYCDKPSRLAIDGITVGEVPPERRSSVRARAGTRSLCLLPADDRRICGQPGTLRTTYLYEGLTLRVHCSP
jgi:hypothetical protein